MPETGRGVSLARLFGKAVGACAPGFASTAPGVWDRTLAPDLVWRLTVARAGPDAATAEGRLFAGVIVRGVLELMPDLEGETTSPGVHSVNLMHVADRGPVWDGWWSVYDAAKVRRVGLLRRPLTSEEADQVTMTELNNMVGAGVRWLEPLRSKRDVALAMRGELEKRGAGHGGWVWPLLGIVLWLDGDRHGARQAWADGEARSNNPSQSRRETARIMAALEQRGTG